MPFAEFNRDNFPNIIVSLTNEDITEDSYEEFVNEMNLNDSYGTDNGIEDIEYSLFFNLSKCTKMYPISYLRRIGKYIKSRKGHPDNHLKFTIMHAKSTSVRTMLRIIFNVTSPSAPLFIIKELDEEVLNDLYTKITEERYSECTNCVKFFPK